MSKTSVDITFNLDRLVRPSIKNISPYSSARDEFSAAGDDLVFLDANENPYGEGINRYPDPYQNDLKSAIARLRKVSPENILVGNGSDEVLDLLFRAFCIPGRSNVVTLPPTYGMYGVLSAVNETAVREVPLDENWQPDPDKIMKAVDEDTRMLFLCSPNNPTGNLMNSAKVKQLLQEFPGLVVIDEAYIDFASKDSWAKQLEKYPNLVVVQTLSKAFGLAGARVGYALTSPKIVGILNTIKPPYNVNALSQSKALETLKNSESANRLLMELEIERAYLVQQLEQLPFVAKVYPSDANFILIRVDDANKRYEQLIERGIVVRNRSRLHGCENTLRITIGSPEENRILTETLSTLSE
ncbi:histidinol-phosphate transaminase [Robertkochia marina]|uniref:Histidinol-phosphate aminotransferase n=1 Tax=Robertkochia marina TaxID=1227945 RepID=A0A4V3UY68_9FLAO|nr:histidinol-phosphate transaminase [Robertkochia marina]THD67926.1 histidinol-phosphate transaminase [Robertkochia marina]TRZ41032.1 histidinol-phosphate transaminase [Robertkochia marina]